MDTTKELLLSRKITEYAKKSNLSVEEKYKIIEHIGEIIELVKLTLAVDEGNFLFSTELIRLKRHIYIKLYKIICREELDKLIPSLIAGIRLQNVGDSLDKNCQNELKKCQRQLEKCQRQLEKSKLEVENMACLNCYACEIKEPYLPKTLGKVDESIGSCINCQAFACGHHGFRDRASCRFECIMCYPSLLASSAGAVAAVENKDLNKQVLYELIIQHHPRRFPQEDLEFPYIYSTKEFYERYPFYKEQLQEKLATTEVNWNLIETERIRNALKSFPENAQEMLHAAGLLVKDKETKKYYPAILIQISAVIIPRNDGGNSYVLY